MKPSGSGASSSARLLLTNFAAADPVLAINGSWMKWCLKSKGNNVIYGGPWTKKAPAPPLPPQVVAATAARYREALDRLIG